MKRLNDLYYERGVFDRIECLLSKSRIAKLRDEYGKDCTRLAEGLSDEINKMGYYASMITFKRLGNCYIHPLKIRDELVDREYSSTHRSVIYLGDAILDLLFSDRIVPLKEYINRLEKDNDGAIRTDRLKSIIYGDNGIKYHPTIEDLKRR